GDSNAVIVGGRAPVAALDGGDEDQDPPLFHDAVRQTGRAAELGAGDLEPDDVVGVVDDPHPVGLGISDAQARLDLGQRRIGGNAPGRQGHSRSASRRRTGSGTSPRTPPPSRATSLTRRLETYEYSSLAMRNTVSMLESRRRFIRAIWSSYS